MSDDDWMREQLEQTIADYEAADRRRREESEMTRAALIEESLHTASTWLEALGKQARLHQIEADAEAEDAGEVGDTWWSDMIYACTLAHELYSDNLAKCQVQIAALEAQITALKNQARLDTANELDNGADGRREVAKAMREIADGDARRLSDWLMW